MRTARALSVVVVVVAVGILSAAGSARAQDASDPNAYTVEGDQSAEYPTELVDRPLLLPQGVEADVYAYTNTNDIVDLFDFVQLGLGGRLGMGTVELFGSVGLLAKQPDGADNEGLRWIAGGGAFEIAPNQALRGELRIWTPTSETFKILDVQGAYQVKRKLGPKLAVVASGGINFINYLPDPEAPDALWEARVTGTGTAQVQLTPQLAAYGSLAGSIPIAKNPEELDPQNYFAVEGGGMLNLAQRLDVYGSIVVGDVFEESRRMTYFYAGALVRL